MPSRANLPRDQSDIESDSEKGTEEVCDKVILRLFNSGTEEDNFSGLTAIDYSCW